MANQSDEGDWRVSTEGDLDPDLTEETGYANWEPQPRMPWRWLYQLGLVVALIGVVGSALMVFLR